MFRYYLFPTRDSNRNRYGKQFYQLLFQTSVSDENPTSTLVIYEDKEFDRSRNTSQPLIRNTNLTTYSCTYFLKLVIQGEFNFYRQLY